MIARLLRSADFERVLRTRSRLSSDHFAIHHLPDRPARPARPAMAAELSTAMSDTRPHPVDDFPPPAAKPEAGAVWLGAVVPKRHARRSVTRNLLKRQIRAVVAGHASALPGGLWVVRLRAPFDRGEFVSASSEPLRRAAHDELERLIGGAAQAAQRR